MCWWLFELFAFNLPPCSLVGNYCNKIHLDKQFLSDGENRDKKFKKGKNSYENEYYSQGRNKLVLRIETSGL
jgi:hypothetical protein